MPSLTLHIGSPKTATTYLQNVVLPQLEGPQVFVKPEVTWNGGQIGIGELFAFESSPWDEQGERFFEEAFGDAIGEDMLVSDENMSKGLPVPLGWVRQNNRPRGGFSYQTPEALVRHLASLLSAARSFGYDRFKVIFTTRRQDTRLASTYAQLSGRIRGASQEKFSEWTRRVADRARSTTLNWHLWYRELTGLLGSENILLLPYESLRNNRSCFLKKWASCLGVRAPAHINGNKRNERSKSRKVWRINRRTLATEVIEKISRVFGYRINVKGEGEIRLTQEVSKPIMKAYHESNKALAEEFPEINFSQYGYC